MIPFLRTILPRQDGFKSDERGATAVELALTAPLVLSVIFCIIEFGLVIFSYGVVNYSAEQATRFATVNYSATNSEIKAVAENSFVLIDPARITDFTVTAPFDPSDQTRLVTVEIGYQHDFSIPYFDFGSLTIRGDSKGFIVEE